MIGVIIGDCSGSFREFTRKEKFPNLPLMPSDRDVRITDDTLLSIATAKALIEADGDWDEVNFAKWYKIIGKEYFESVGGFGGRFREWVSKEEIDHSYHSFGNGSAMRVSPVAYVAESFEELMHLATKSAMVTHNHPEGIKGAQATAYMVWLARQGHSIHKIIEMCRDVGLYYEPLRYLGKFDNACQETMRLVTYVLLNTESFEEAMKAAVTIPYSDADTIGAIVGSIAGELYDIPIELETQALGYVASYPSLMAIIHEFVDFISERNENGKEEK